MCSEFMAHVVACGRAGGWGMVLARRQCGRASREHARERASDACRVAVDMRELPTCRLRASAAQAAGTSADETAEDLIRMRRVRAHW